MIAKSLTICILLLASYLIFVSLNYPNGLAISYAQKQGNVLKAEKFLYNKADTIKTVIVGSSLAARLNDINNCFNLALPGLSIFDGFKIIEERQGELPSNILIETNILLRPEAKDFTQLLSDPVSSFLKGKFSPLREGNRPLDILIGKILIPYYYMCIDIVKKVLVKLGILSSQKYIESKNRLGLKTNYSAFKAMLNLQINNQKELNLSELKTAMLNLKAMIDPLRKKGVRIVFFEMPVDYHLTNTPRSVAIRQEFYRNFPPNKYRYFMPPSSIQYSTTDGMHLAEDQAVKYTLFINEQIKTLHVSN